MADDQKPASEDTKKWGTHIMAAPTVHPDNQLAATWQAQAPPQQPYVVLGPAEKPADNPLEHVAPGLTRLKKSPVMSGTIVSYLPVIDLSTRAGPVSVDSDRPLSLTAPCGQEAWSYFGKSGEREFWLMGFVSIAPSAGRCISFHPNNSPSSSSF